MSSVMPVTEVQENGTRNQYQKNDSGFWSVCHAIWYGIFLVPVYVISLEHVLFCYQFWYQQ